MRKSSKSIRKHWPDLYLCHMFLVVSRQLPIIYLSIPRGRLICIIKWMWATPGIDHHFVMFKGYQLYMLCFKYVLYKAFKCDTILRTAPFFNMSLLCISKTQSFRNQCKNDLTYLKLDSRVPNFKHDPTIINTGFGISWDFKIRL